MTSFPHNLVLDPQPRFGLTPVEYSLLYNFLISKPILMKIVAECLACVCLSYKVHLAVCNPFPLIRNLSKPTGNDFIKAGSR